jgi:diguanylate cyclase (GGDEF)-like protein/PAS domain S-box-containing protein
MIGPTDQRAQMATETTALKLPGWARRLALMPVHGVAVALAIYALIWSLFVFGPGAATKVGSVVMIWGRYPLMLAGIALGFLAARAHAGVRREKLAWLLLSSAFGAIVLGDIVWGYLTVVRGENATLSLSNVFFLSYFPLVLAGLLLLPRMFRSRNDAAMFALDAATVAVGIGMGIWYAALRPALGAIDDGPGVRMLIALAYPIGDMLTVLGIALVLLRQPLGGGRRVSVLLASSLLCSLFGDSLWILGKVLGVVQTAGGSYFLWLLQAIFFFAAAREELRRRLQGDDHVQTRQWRDAFSALPVVASVFGFLLLALVARQGDRDALDGTLIGATLLLVLVICRHQLGQRETATLLAENIQRRGESRFAALIEHASDAILIADAKARVLYASPATSRLLDHDLPLGTPLAELVHTDDRPGLADYIAGCTRGEVTAATLALRFSTGGGRWASTETTLSNLLHDAQVAGIVLNVRDVSERKQLEEQLRFQALHDPISGLANRELFSDRAARALLRCQQGDDVVAVAIINLDRFKVINESLGHLAGNQILAAAAQRLREALTGADSLARLAGDEFGVLFEDTGQSEPIAARVDQLRSALGAPLNVDGHGVRLTASAGYAISANVDSLETLLRHADLALHHARAGGGNRTEVFSSGQHARSIDRYALEAALPGLLESGAFTLQFQPIVRLDTGRPLGLHIELDWRDRGSAPAPIADALRAARDAGLGDLTGRWLLKAVERDVAALLRYVPGLLGMSLMVRLEPSLLRDPALVDDVRKLLKRLDVPPRDLVFELHQTPAATLHALADAGLSALRETGTGLALSGFGSAALGFDTLTALPFDVLVLDAAVLPSLEATDRPGALVKSALAAGRALGMRVIAGGIASEAQAKTLRDLGCEQGLGDTLAPPMSYEKVLTWLLRRFAEISA